MGGTFQKHLVRSTIAPKDAVGLPGYFKTPEYEEFMNAFRKSQTKQDPRLVITWRYVLNHKHGCSKAKFEHVPIDVLQQSVERLAGGAGLAAPPLFAGSCSPPPPCRRRRWPWQARAGRHARPPFELKGR